MKGEDKSLKAFIKKKMSQINKLKKCIIYLILFYIFTSMMTIIGLNATYKNINYVGNLPEQIKINLAQATRVNGRIYGEVTSTENADLNGKYIKVEIYTKKGHLAGTKYLEITDTQLNEPRKFMVNFTAENIGNYTINVVEDSEEVQRGIITCRDLYKDVFTDEEMKMYTTVTLVLLLTFGF